MRIRTQNILAIAPIFLFVSLAIGALQYNAMKTDLTWGARQEATSLSVAAAAHLEREFRDSRNLNPLKNADLARSLTRMMDWEKARQIAIFDLQDNKLLFSEERFGSKQELKDLSTDSNKYFNGDNEYYTSDIIDIQDENLHVVNSYAAIRNEDGKIAAIFFVQTDAAYVEQALAEMFRKIVWNSIGMLTLGCLLAFLLSGIIAKNIKMLNSAAHNVAEGNYSNILKNGWIQEINDLANTFHTMNSILKDNILKSKRAVIDSEISRSNFHLIETFNKDFLGDREVEIDLTESKISIAFCMADKCNDSDFYGIVETNQKILIYLASLNLEGIHQEIALRSAAQTYCEQLLKTSESKDVFDELNEQFELKDWQLLEVTKSLKSPLQTAKFFRWNNKERRVLVSRPDFTSSGLLILSGRNPHQRNSRLLRFANKFEGLSASELRHEVMPVLKFEKQGATIIMGEA